MKRIAYGKKITYHSPGVSHAFKSTRSAVVSKVDQKAQTALNGNLVVVKDTKDARPPALVSRLPASGQLPEIPAKELMAVIKSTDSLAGLSKLWNLHGSKMNIYHLPILLSRIAMLAQRLPEHTARPNIRALITAVTVQISKMLLQLDAQAVVTCLLALGRLKCGHLDLVGDLMYLSTRILEDLNGQGLANLIQAVVLLRLRPQRSWFEAFLQSSEYKLDVFTLQGISVTVWALGKLKMRPSKRWWDTCLGQVDAQELTARQLCMLLHGLANLRAHPSSNLSGKLIQAGYRELNAFTNQGLAIACWGAACLDLEGNLGFLEAARKRAGPRLASFKVQELCIMLQASTMCLKKKQILTEEDKEWVGHLISQAENNISHFGVRSLSMLLYSLGRLEVQPSAAFMTLYWRHSLPLLARFSSQGLANTLWGLAHLKIVPDNRWLGLALDRFDMLLDDARPGEMGQFMWALQVMKHPPSYTWLYRFESAALEKLGQFEQRNLCQVVGAFAVFEYVPTNEFVEGLMRQMSVKVKLFNAFQLSHLFSCFAHLRLHPPQPLLAEVVAQFTHSLIGARPPDISDMVSAVLELGYRPPDQWLNAMMKEVQFGLDRLQPAQCGRLVAGVVTARHNPGGAWMDSLGALILREKEWSSAQIAVPLIHCLGALGWTPPPGWVDEVLARFEGSESLGELKTRHLMALAKGLAILSKSEPHQVLARLVKGVEGDLKGWELSHRDKQPETQIKSEMVVA